MDCDGSVATNWQVDRLVRQTEKNMYGRLVAVAALSVTLIAAEIIT